MIYAQDPETRRSRSLGFERSHVDDEAVFYIALEHAFVGVVDLIHPDHFDIAGDIVLSAEIEHLLCFRNATDQ